MATTGKPLNPLSRRIPKGVGMTSERTKKRLLERLRSSGISNEAVLQAMEAVPRHLFVDEALASRAYENISLPIGHGQTISQPYIVAAMSEVIRVEPGSRVLEVGTGSGYQAAVLAELGALVFSVEIVEPLAERAAAEIAAQSSIVCASGHSR